MRAGGAFGAEPTAAHATSLVQFLEEPRRAAPTEKISGLAAIRRASSRDNPLYRTARKMWSIPHCQTTPKARPMQGPAGTIEEWFTKFR
jgi:hypothetical protein